jgi:uroporphyrinogen decarboxylase
MTMTPRQRWLALFAGQEPDRVPTDYWATPEFHARLKRDLGCADDEALWQRLHIDRPRGVGPRNLEPHHPDDPQADMWGIRYRPVNYGTGTYDEVAHCPLAAAESIAQVHAHRWPSADQFDYAPVTAKLAADDGTCLLQGGQYEPFLIYCRLRGLEQGFEDLLLNPEIADAILTHLFEFHYERNRRIFEAAGRGRLDMFPLAEDLGGQHGPLISVSLYKRFLLPNQKKMADLARSYGARIFYHTDGAAYDFLPLLIDEVGIDVLNPIQWRCPGMERERLVRDFGKRIIFHGAMDNQHTLPFGSVADVRQEVRDNLRLFADARWICAPCHNIQAVTPTENVVAMYETIHELGARSA